MIGEFKTSLDKQLERFRELQESQSPEFGEKVSDSVVSFALGEAALRRGLRLDALTAFQDVLRVRDAVEARLAVTKIFLSQGMLSEAQNELARAFVLDPHSVPARLLGEELRAALGEGQSLSEELLEHLNRPAYVEAVSDARLRMKLEAKILERELQELTRNVALDPGEAIHEYLVEEAKKRLSRHHETQLRVEKLGETAQKTLAPPVLEQPLDAELEPAALEPTLEDVTPVPAPELFTPSVSETPAAPPDVEEASSMILEAEPFAPMANLSEPEVLSTPPLAEVDPGPLLREEPAPIPVPESGLLPTEDPLALDDLLLTEDPLALADLPSLDLEQDLPSLPEGLRETPPSPPVTETLEPALSADPTLDFEPAATSQAELPMDFEPEPVGLGEEVSELDIGQLEEASQPPLGLSLEPSVTDLTLEPEAQSPGLGFDPLPSSTPASEFDPPPSPASEFDPPAAPPASEFDPPAVPQVSEFDPPTAPPPEFDPSTALPVSEFGAPLASTPAVSEFDPPPSPASEFDPPVAPSASEFDPPAVPPISEFDPPTAPPPEFDPSTALPVSEPDAPLASTPPVSEFDAPAATPVSEFEPPAPTPATEFDPPAASVSEFESPVAQPASSGFDPPPSVTPPVLELEASPPLTSSDAEFESPLMEPATLGAEFESPEPEVPSISEFDPPSIPETPPISEFDPGPVVTTPLDPEFDSAATSLTPAVSEFEPPAAPPAPEPVPPTTGLSDTGKSSPARLTFYQSASPQLAELTATLSKTRGVTSTFLVTQFGEVLEHSSGPEVTPEMIGETVVEGLDFLTSFAAKPKYWVLECNGGIFVMQTVDERHVLVAVGQAGANFGALRYTMDKTKSKFANILAGAPD